MSRSSVGYPRAEDDVNHVHDFEPDGTCECGEHFALVPHRAAAPADRVEALAKVLYEAFYRCRAEFMISAYHETVTVNWNNEAPQDKDEWRAVARAALAHARGLVPELQQYRRVADPVRVDGWNACRAETLRRLGGDP